jgi:hypothetical protein
VSRIVDHVLFGTEANGTARTGCGRAVHREASGHFSVGKRGIGVAVDPVDFRAAIGRLELCGACRRALAKVDGVRSLEVAS